MLFRLVQNLADAVHRHHAFVSIDHDLLANLCQSPFSLASLSRASMYASRSNC